MANIIVSDLFYDLGVKGVTIEPLWLAIPKELSSIELKNFLGLGVT